MAFVHQLVSFEEEMDVLVNSTHSIAECDDDDDALRDAWSLLDDPDEANGQRQPRQRRGDDGPPPCARKSRPAVTPAVSRCRRANIEERYLVDPRILGAGHEGSVRECVDRSTGERRAVKSVRKGHPSVEPGRIDREVELLREVRHHKNIVRLVDVFEDDKYVHIVTDLCRGGELFDRIVRKSSSAGGGGGKDGATPCFAEDEAARIMYQILGAVSHMHGRGIAHRDIKPENILFDTADDDSPVRIIDFGLSSRHDPDTDAPMSSLVGTPYYIAPEVLLGRYDRRCDLWSVGVIAYVLLCGYPPFGGATDRQTHESVLRGRYEFHPEDWGGISAEAMDFVRGLLRADPRRRTTVQRALSHPWIVRHVYSVLNDMLD
jgi:serine/threonine protein kinase